MNIIELRKLVLAVLLSFAAVTMLPACSSDGGESSSCDCAEGDWNCMDRCTQPGD